MKYIPQYSKRNIRNFIKALEKYPTIEYSTQIVDRIAASGDSTGSAFNHWHWKLKSVADIVIWPSSTDQVQLIMQLVDQFEIPCTPRGGGTCYYGSGIPAMGGVLLDMKQLDTIRIDPQRKIAVIGGGVVFHSLKSVLKSYGLEIMGYPSSGKSATIAGWISAGAKAGIGITQYRSFTNQIKAIQLISVQGHEFTFTKPKQIKKYIGSTGSLGIITKITINLQSKTEKYPYYYVSNSISQLLQTISKLNDDPQLYFLRFGQITSHSSNLLTQIPNSYHFYLFVVLNSPNKNSFDSLHLMNQEVAKFHWNQICEYETRLKTDIPLLFIQQFWVDLSSLMPLIRKFNQLCNRYQHKGFWYGMVGKEMKVRLLVCIPTNNETWLHFLLSKAIGHLMTKMVYNLGGKVYIYGLQNTPYLHHYEKSRIKHLRTLKREYDSKFLLNPLKLTSTRISYLRLDILFQLNLWFFKLKHFIKKKN